MATKALLTDLIAQFTQAHPDVEVTLESVGGVDAARRVQSGEVFDVVALAANAIDQLIGEGHLSPAGRIDMVRSDVAVAVPAGAPHPDIHTEDALKAAILAAPSLGYSTGPSGVQLARLFERWGIAGQIQERIVTPPPGVPVGSLVATGEVALGFQQRSELMHLPGIDVLGGMPEPVQIVTVFSAARCLRSPAHASDAVDALLAFLASPATGQTKQMHGMAPA